MIPAHAPALPAARTASPASASATASASARRGDPAALKGWVQLTPAQRSLFGPNGAATYRALSQEQRAIFLLLTTRLAQNGLDLTGLRLQDPAKTIRPNRLLFAPGPALDRLEAQLAAGKEKGRFQDDSPFAPFHWGRSEFGARENRAKWSMQIGIGDRGAFVDVDRYNPWAGPSAFIGHAAELLVPGKPEADDIARDLGTPIFRNLQRRIVDLFVG